MAPEASLFVADGAGFEPGFDINHLPPRKALLARSIARMRNASAFGVA
jgi:hypothetical protein